MIKIKKKFYPIALVLIAVQTLLSGCDLNPSTDGSISSGSCTVNDYGYAQFSNRSATNRDYFIYWDGSYLNTVRAGETAPQDGLATKTGNHELIFKFTDGTVACGPETVNIDKCNTHEFTCSN